MPMVDDLSERFRKNVGRSTHVDIAVAWATETSMLDQLESVVDEYDVSLRIIVGTHDNITEPDALDRLNDIGELRIVPDEGPLFHPKVYIFRGDEKSVAWIGSANFTNGGFGRNVEAVFETQKWESALEWFDEQWKECGKLPKNAIKQYRSRRSRNPPPRIPSEMPGREPGGRLEYLDQVRNWREYIKSLDKCQEWYKSHRIDYTVYGETCSWTDTINKIKYLTKKENNWNSLNKDEVKKLLGMYYDDVKLNSGLLGVMRAPAEKRFFQEIELRRKLKGAINSVVDAEPVRFPHVAVEAVYKMTTGEEHIGIGVATRLLALARPDMVVSVNSRSSRGLGQIFPGIDKLYIPTRDAQGVFTQFLSVYSEFLRQLYNEPWFDSKEPSDAFEKKLWSMRAALLDCFVYDP